MVTLPSIILILIAILFKNQTRPITNLAKAAKDLVKEIILFGPSGAREIRNAAYEFDRMAKRINRHLNQDQKCFLVLAMI